MRKLILAVLLSTLLAAGCTSAVTGAPVAAPPSADGCAPAAAPAGFADKQGRFALTPPDGWRVDTSGKGGNAARFVDPELDRTGTGPFEATVTVRISPATFDLAGGVAGFREELADVEGYDLTTDEPLNVGGCMPAHLFGGIFVSADNGLKVQNLQVLAVHGGSAIVVTGSAPQANWTDHESQLAAAVRSLTVPS